MLEKVARKAAKEALNLETFQSDGRHVDVPDDSIHLAFLNHVYHEVDDKPSMLIELRRLLRPGGRLVIVENVKKPFLGLGPPAMVPDKIVEAMKESGFSKTRTDQGEESGASRGNEVSRTTSLTERLLSDSLGRLHLHMEAPAALACSFHC